MMACLKLYLSIVACFEKLSILGTYKALLHYTMDVGDAGRKQEMTNYIPCTYLHAEPTG